MKTQELRQIIKEEINIRTVSKRYVKAFEYVMKNSAKA